MVLLTCENGINFIEEIETEVKIANNKFLIINSSSPEQNAKQINPSITVEIELDRAVNMNTVNTNSILITGGSNPYEEFTAAYNASTKILSITPTDILDASTEYTVTINENLKGTDGSVLLDNYIFAFTTGDLPAGDVWINDSDPNNRIKNTASREFTDDPDIYFYMTYNAYTTQFRWSTSQFGTYTSWQAIGSSEAYSIPWSDANDDGYYEIWVEFGDGDTIGNPDNTSELRYDGVYLDITPGTVDITSSFSTVLADSNNTLNLYANNTGAESGIQSYAWSSSAAAGGNATAQFGNSAAEDTTVTVTGQNTSTYGTTSIDLTLTATDRLGRTFDDTVTVNLDTYRPNTPSVSGSSITLSQRPSWNWSSNGGGGQGFRYQLGSTSGTWSLTSSGTSYTPSSNLSDGLHRLYVGEQDISGNWSYSGSYSTRVTPMIPYNGQSGVIYFRGITASWRETNSSDVYTLQLLSGKTIIGEETGITTNSYSISGSYFQSRTTYTWRVLVYDYRGTYKRTLGPSSFTTL